MNSILSNQSRAFQMSRSFNNSPINIQSNTQDKSKVSFNLQEDVVTAGTVKIDLQGRNIQVIDHSIEFSQNFEIVVLDNNQIEDLQGIQQFARVKQLSLMHNQIGDILNVYHLKNLSQLEELDLRGNPITTRPGYRPTVLLFLKNLKVLDGRDIKASERLKVPQELTSQYAVLDRLLKNYAEILRLQSVVQRIEMMKDLLNLNRGYVITFVPFDLDKLRRLYNYHDSIDERVRNGFRADLLRDVRLIELEFLRKQDMQAAASELLTRQTKSINELNNRIRQKVQTISALHRESMQRFDLYAHSPEELLLPSDLYPKSPFRKSFRASHRSVSPPGLGPPNVVATVNEIFNFQRNPFDSVNQSTLSLRSPVEEVPPKKSLMSTRPVHKSVVYERLYSPKRSKSPKPNLLSPDHPMYSSQGMLKSAYQKDLFETYQRLSHKEGDLPRRGRPQSPEDLLNYVSPTSQNMSPNRKRTFSPNKSYRMTRSDAGFGQEQEGVEFFEEILTKKDLEAREAQLDHLGKNLDQKIEELAVLEQSNTDLKEKLRNLLEQNDIEVRQARDEIEKASREVQNAEQTKERLEAEIARIRRNIAELAISNTELERRKLFLLEEREDLKKYESELNAEQLLEARGAEAYQWYEQKLEQKAFRLWSMATDYSKKVNQLYWRRRLREERELLAKTFGMIKRNNIVNKIVAYKQSRIYMRDIQLFFDEWKLYTKHQKVGAALVIKKQKSMLSTAFGGWQQYKEMSQLKKTVQVRIAGYYRENLVRRSFNGLKNYFGLYGLGGAAEKTMKSQAVAANMFWIKKTSFLKWHKFIKEYAIPKKLGLNAAHEQYRTTLLRSGLSLLQNNYVTYQDLYNKADMLHMRKDMRIIESVFSSWKNDYMQMRAKKRADNKEADLFLMRGKLDLWKIHFVTAKRLSELEKRAQEHYEINMKKKSLQVFTEVLEKGIASHKLESALARKNDALLLKTMYQGWRDLFLQLTQKRRRERLEGIEAQALALKMWKIYSNQQKEKNRKLALADRQHRNILEKLAKLVIFTWKDSIVQKKRRGGVEKTITQKRTKRVYKNIFKILQDLKIRGMKERLGKLGEDQEEVQKKIQESEERISQVNKERLGLFEKVDELTDSLENLKEENERKGREIERYEEIIKDKEKRQIKLETEVKNKRARVDELEEAQAQTNKKLAEKSKEDETVLDNLKEEKEYLNNAIHEVMAEMKAQDRTIAQAEEENISLREKKERYMKESVQAIDDLKKELRLINEGIDSKDQEVRRSIELIQALERRNQELRIQLHATVIDLERSTVDYRSRVKTLEQKNAELIFETDKLKVENERRGKEIIELHGTAKKYEYEIHYLKSGPDHRRLPRSRSPLRNALLRSFEDQTFMKVERETVQQQNGEITQQEEQKPNNETQIEEEIGDLKSFLIEKRKRLDKLDERQDELRRQVLVDKVEEEPIVEEEPQVEETPQVKSVISIEEMNARGVRESKKKIEEIRRKLEGAVHGSSKNPDDSLREDFE